MRTSKKILSVVLVLATLLCFFNFGVAAYAATPTTQTTVNAYAGETVTVEFSEISCYGVSGDISYSNRSLFTSVTPVSSSYGQVREKKFILSSDEKFTPVVKLKVTVSSSAAVGSTCVVTFNVDARVDSNVDFSGPGDYFKTVTVKVVERPTTSTPVTSTPVTSTPVTSTPATSTPATSTPATSTPATSTPATSTPTVTSKPTTSKPATSSTPGVKLDLTELNAQIGTAQGLTASDYTVDSWAKVKAALNAAIAARKANKQADVDAAAKALKEAIAGLVKIDGTQLQKLVDSVNDFLAEDAMAQVRDALDKALEDAAAALKSGKQDEINTAYNNLAKALEDYKAKLAEISKGETIEVEKPVEVDPDGPFCNIWLHKLWLVLLIISLCANVVFIVLTVRYFVRRKKQLADDMPLVDYNINED